MFHSRKIEHRINKIHKRALKLVYQDYPDLTFLEFLAIEMSVSVHQKNLQLLATEIFKSKAGMSPELMNDIFHFVETPYNLRSDYTLERKQDHTVYHGSESFFHCSQIVGSSTKLNKKFCFSQGIQNKN